MHRPTTCAAWRSSRHRWVSEIIFEWVKGTCSLTSNISVTRIKLYSLSEISLTIIKEGYWLIFAQASAKCHSEIALFFLISNSTTSRENVYIIGHWFAPLVVLSSLKVNFQILSLEGLCAPLPNCKGTTAWGVRPN